MALALAVSLVLAFPVWAAAQQGDTHATWVKRVAALKRDPDVLRHYTFQTVTLDNPVVPSVAGEQEALTYVARGPLQIVQGRWPGKKAVRIDRGPFRGKPFAPKGKSFTVECWFRKHGHGAELGNGRTNGMIFAQGDGYWAGLRVWTMYPSRHLRFEIGRPKPSRAFGLTARDVVVDGVWHHLAATWDGDHMRLYLNGLLLAAAEYRGEYTAPNAPFRVGFANAGVGSIKMDVDEVVVYSRARSAAEILQSAHLGAALSEQAQGLFMQADAAITKRDWAAASEAFERITSAPGPGAEYRSLARLWAGRMLAKRGRVAEAVKQFAALCDDASASEAAQQTALRLCVHCDLGSVSGQAPRSMYERLLRLPDLDERQQISVRLGLAERCLEEGDAAAAGEQFAAVLGLPSLSPRERRDIGLRMAHMHLRTGSFAKARAEYAKLAQQPDAPFGFESHARLCLARTFLKEKNWRGAIDAFRDVQHLASAPGHHRQEAEECIREIQRMQRGLPARDPKATRVPTPKSPKPGATICVAADGSDANPGTQAKPLASLAGSRDAIRSMKARGALPPGGVAVVVQGGEYPLQQTVELTEQDSGTADAPVVYRAASGQRPVFTGGVRVTGFTPVTDPAVLARLPQEARGKVLRTDLSPQGITDFGKLNVRGYGRAGYPTRPWVDLYVDGKAMQLARWPNEGFVKIGKVTQGEFVRRTRSADPGIFEFEGDRPLRWQQAKDVWMYGLWGHLWAGRCLRVASIDPGNRRITTGQKDTYGFRKGYPYYYFNLLEEIDQPGEWYLDRDAGVLYLYPPKPLRGATVELPISSAPFVKMDNVSHVTARGLTFELGRAEGVVISGGENVLLAGCTIRRLGTNGVVILGGRSHGVLGCDIHTLGAGGIRVAGGEWTTLGHSGHFIENCHVHDFSRVDRAYAPAVHADGIGMRISHNLFHDSPHHAMRVEGYEHRIEFNEIHSVVYESDDQAGIDMWGNPAYRGNVMRYNFWHHIGSGHEHAGQAGIRLDDYISQVLMYGNVFWRCSGGRFGAVQIHGGKDNIADNNLFVDCKYAFSFSPWGQARWTERVASAGPRISRHDVDITKPPFSTRYPDLAHMDENADRNFIWRNVAVNCGQLTVRERGVNELVDNLTFRGDPGFADLAKRNLRLPADSPVYSRSGFRPIPFDEIGLYEDEFRASWPVKHEVTPLYVREY